MAPFSDAFAEVEAAIGEIKDSIALISTRQQILRNAQEVFRMEGRRVEIKSIMDSFFDTRTTSTDTLFRGLYIQLGSIFELFIRRCMEASLQEQSKRAKTFEELPESLRNNNLVFSGQALAAGSDKISGKKIDFEEISRKLGTCISSNENFELNVNCFTLFIGNCTSYRVSKLMRSVSVKGDIWDNLGREKNLQNHLGSKATRETTKLAREKLDEYIETRNGIVHRGEYFKTITENQMIDNSNFFIALTKALAKYLEST